VGFGDAFQEPLPLQGGVTRQEGHKTVRLERQGERWLDLEDRGEGFRPQYSFDLTPRLLNEFAARHVWQQTAPDSHFTQDRLCSRATVTGRITLHGHRLIRTEHGVRTEQELSPAQWEDALHTYFG